MTNARTPGLLNSLSRGRRWAWGLGLLATLLLSAGVWHLWASDLPVSGLVARWGKSPSRFIPIDGVLVHIRDEGPRDDPHPLVLLHGTSASLHTWDGWVAALKGQRRVVRVDLLGFGLTGPAADEDYRIAAYEHFVKDVLDHTGLKQVVMVGNSFGGYIAWKFAVDHPTRVSQLVLVDSAGYASTAQSVPIAFRLAQVSVFKPLLAKLLPRSMVASSVRSVYGHPDRITPDLIDRYFELTLREGNREALFERFEQSPNGEFAEQIKQVSQPTLLIWGGQDHLIPLDSAKRFERDIAGSRLVVFDDLGHVPHEEDPQRTVAALQAFLQP